MADKTIGELPGIAGLYDDSLIPVEQQGVASRMTGKQFADFARDAGQAAAGAEVQKAAREAQRATAAADAAEQSGNKAKAEADRSKSEADRAEKLRESIEVDYDALHQAVRDAEDHADRAEAEADRSEDAAALSKSWAAGGTGTRQGEDENNARYWADRAQAEAERTSVPPVEGVYNVILSDRVTGERYALLVEDGRLALLGVSDDLDAADLLLVDRESGISYAVIVEGGRLKIEKMI